MGKGVTVLATGEIALKRHQFGALLEGDAMVHVIVVHVAVGAVSCASDAARNGGCIKPNLIGQRLQTCMDFLARIQTNKQVFAASRPFHDKRFGRKPMRVPFTLRC